MYVWVTKTSATWYQNYPWLHYIQEDDSVLCFYFATAVQNRMPVTGYSMFSITGLATGKKLLRNSINMHNLQAIAMHAVDMAVMGSKPSMDVGEKLSTALSEERAKNRNYVYAILFTIRFLARQELPLRGRY